MLVTGKGLGICGISNLRQRAGQFSKLYFASSRYCGPAPKISSRRGVLFSAISAHAAHRDQPAKIVSSPNNAYVKHCSKLRTNSKYRQEEQAALLPGVIPILELRRDIPDLPIKTLLWSGAHNIIPEELREVPRLQVSDEILRKVSGLQTVNGLLAAAEVGLPEETDFSTLPKGRLKRLLVLDGVQDPGNLGTLLRTAEALGWQGAFFLEGCCDPFNDKALRASRGATFKLPMAYGRWGKLSATLQHHGMTCYAADSHDMTGQMPVNRKQGNDDTKRSSKSMMPLALVLGAEGQGLSEIVRNNSKAVSIPMTGSMESLCVSQAGAILLYLLRHDSNMDFEEAREPDEDFEW